MSQPLLSIQNLSIRFGNDDAVPEVLKNFNLDIFGGRKYALVGESGSGKSVSMLSICRLITGANYTSGNIQFLPTDQEPFNLLTAENKAIENIRGREISYIFQEPMTALNPLMTCGKQVAEIIPNQNMKQVLEIFRQVKLPDPERIAKSYPHQISGGQRQRVMIAMAIANNPKILIADEPTTALDASVQHTILELLKEICESRKMALIFISHDLELVKDLADEITVMYKGETVEQGTTEQIINNPKHPYTKALMAIKPSFRLKGKYLPTLDSILTTGKMEADSWEISTYQDSEPILTIEGLDKSFDKTGTTQNKVLSDITFTVNQGETLGIVGESGCGKSTLAKVLVKLHTPEGGQILLERKSIYDLGKKYRREVQMVFQDPFSSLNPKKTASETLTEPMLVHHLYKSQEERIQRASDLLESVGLLKSHLNRYPHEFSGGQRQRLCIARALSVDPKIIICDESVSALDVSVQAQILNLLKDLQIRMGLTYLFISHDLHVVTYFCNRVMVLNQGKTAELKTTDELMKSQDDDYTRRLFSYI